MLGRGLRRLPAACARCGATARGGPRQVHTSAVLAAQVADVASLESAELFSGLPPGIGPAAAYAQLVEEGLVRHDEDQVLAVEPLDALWEALAGERLSRAPVLLESREKTTSIGGGGSSSRDGYLTDAWSSLGFGSKKKPAEAAVPEVRDHSTHRGIYLHGGVGCGKTMILDLVYHCVVDRHDLLDLGEPLDGPAAARVHFNAFMLDVNQRIYMMRAGNQEGDPIPELAEQMLSEHGALLCFDEFQVTDVADAMILGRLFSAMWARGAIVVATSNRAPGELYKDGLHRERFLPFIDELEQRCHVHAIGSDIDYRQLGARGDEVFFLAGGDDAGREGFEAAWQKQVVSHSAYGPEQPTRLRTSSRRIEITRTTPTKAGERGAARMTFEELCGGANASPLGPSDYLALGWAFHTVFIEGLPQLTATDSDEARRLISAVDAFYEHKTTVVALSDVEPEAIFDAGLSVEEEEERRRVEKLGDLLDSGKYVQHSDDEAFAFARAVSRLREMQTQAYQAASQEGVSLESKDGAGFLLAFEGQELDEESVREIWNWYDADDSNDLDRGEMRALVEDLCMVREGRRDVTDEQVEAAFDALCGETAPGEEGRITWDRFLVHMLMEGLVVEGISKVALSRRQHQTRLSDKTTFLVYQGAEGADYTSY